MRSSRTRVAALTTLSLLLACAKQLEGPTPSLSGVSPPAVCTAQHATTVALSGAGLSPVVTGALSGAKLEIPAISLRQVQDLGGAAVSAAPLSIPDDPSDPAQSRVRWVSQERMSFDVFPELSLAAGLHDVLATNAQGAEARFPASLLAVPPPVLSAASPDLVCGDDAASIVLTGAHFVRSDASVPTVLAGTTALEVADLASCAPLPGTAGLSQCGAITAAIPAGRLAPGVHALTVANPAPISCTSSEPVSLTVVSRPAISAFAPSRACGAADVTLSISGTGFLTVDGAGPVLRLASEGGTLELATVASGCSAVDGPSAAVESCTALSAVLAAEALPAGNYVASLRNPAPAGCAATETFTLTVVADPVLASVQPAAVCSGDARLVLAGSGFDAGAEVLLGGVPATTVEVSADGTSAFAVFPGPIATGGPFDVTIRNAAACEDTRAAATTVVAGPQVFFVDPAVVYNGISVQATVYGSGFTGGVDAVSLVPADGGADIPLSFTYDLARPNQVQVVVPVGTTPGAYGVRLEDGTDCAAFLADAVTVTSDLTLELAAVAMDPAFGWTGSSTAVSISGAQVPGAGRTGSFAPVPRVYLNPSAAAPGSVAAALGAVAVMDEHRLAALVPGGLPVGLYDLVVVNPDGKVAVSTGAFEVTSLAPPLVETISPGSVPNTGAQAFRVLGSDFRSPEVSLACFDATGAMLSSAPAATVTAWTASTIDVAVDDASLGGAACIVRATNPDEGTFAHFSALVFTTPSQNLYPALSGPPLAAARRAPIVLGGDATPTARFLHVLGGDDGTSALGSVETSALSLVGAPAAFRVQRDGLVEPRTLAAGARIGRFLYVAGGSSAAGGGSPLATVERAYVLDPADRGEVTDLLLDVAESGGVGPGLFYYRVAAVMASSDPLNPGGENIASDPFPVKLPDLGGRGIDVTVQWRAIPGAAAYRVYRSAVPGAEVGTEIVVAAVDASATRFTDTGVTEPAAPGAPLAVGALGRWHTLPAALSVAREGSGVAFGRDPDDARKAYLYVLGGRTSTPSVAALASYEYLPLTLGEDGSQLPDAAGFRTGTSALAAARWQVAASGATNELSSRIPAGTTYVYVLSGLDAAGAGLVQNTEAGLVAAGGDLGTFTSVGPNMARAGYASVVAANLVFAFGGSQASPDASIASGIICGPGVTGCPLGTTAPKVANWNTGQTMLVPRYLHGGVLHGAYIYVAGGLTGSPAAPTTSTEYRIW